MLSVASYYSSFAFNVFFPTAIQTYSIFKFGHGPVLILTIILTLFYYFSRLVLDVLNVSLPQFSFYFL